MDKADLITRLFLLSIRVISTRSPLAVAIGISSGLILCGIFRIFSELYFGNQRFVDIWTLLMFMGLGVICNLLIDFYAEGTRRRRQREFVRDYFLLADEAIQRG